MNKVNKFVDIIKWFYPGMHIKRWIILSGFGILLIVVGSAQFKTEQLFLVKILYGIVVVSGVTLLVLGIKRMLRSFLMIFIPQRDTNIVDLMYQKRQLERGPRIVTVGGGTGLSVILSGLKEYTSNITAIVTVADSGGSSGRLREQFDILPPGDIRNCLVALADAPLLMRDLFQFRFDKNSEFSGHNFGNLFITVMTQLTGDFEKAIKESSRVLAIRGQVIPSTLSNVTLVAQHQNGSTTEGEDRIPKAEKLIEKVYLRPSGSLPTPEAIKAIEEAQIIVLGPGSLYTSIIPNLLINEITERIVASDAMKIYVCNIMTQHGETDGYSASDHLNALIKHSHPKILDYCIVNNTKLPEHLVDRYRQEKSYPIAIDQRKIRAMGYRVIEDEILTAEDYIRHDPVRLAKIILGLIEEV
jgi:uncharacterized cofD-like protein